MTDLPPGQQSTPPDSSGGASSGDDTAAFQRYYRDGDTAPEHGLVYRLLVGWWRRD